LRSQAEYRFAKAAIGSGITYAVLGPARRTGALKPKRKPVEPYFVMRRRDAGAAALSFAGCNDFGDRSRGGLAREIGGKGTVVGASDSVNKPQSLTQPNPRQTTTHGADRH